MTKTKKYPDRFVAVQISIADAAEIIKGITMNEAILKAKGVAQLINNDPLIKALSVQFTEEEFDVVLSEIKELVEEKRLEAYN